MGRHATIRQLVSGAGLVAILGITLAACGGPSAVPSTASHGALTAGSSRSSNASNTSAGAAAPNVAAGSNIPAGSNSQKTSPASDSGAQYLSKTLSVSLAVKDPVRTSADLRSYLTSTDPKATSTGGSVEQQGDNTYIVQMVYSVQATLYPQIEQYLEGYAAQNGGKLQNLRETVQDLTNDYIDSQSRLSNLKAEQQRLQTLMSKAQAIGDVITIEQRLSDVEGQIESIEAHLNALSGQVTMYTVTITLVPLSTIGATPVPNPGWKPLQTLKDALGAALAVAQVLGSLLIWVAVFSVFLLPVALISLLWRRWRAARRLPSMRAPVEANP